ncbi:MAG: hypothetical protein AB3P07_05880 [Wolbachia pipientis]
MLKNTFPYSNNRHIRQLPHMLKINLHTRLDDGKDPKPEINDKTKNELKEKIKNELKKDLKFEIGDKTKNELKEKIKNELEKDLKFEIGDKTKNELKEKIKNELEKDLKFEIGDKTKNEIKDKIKKEIEDEIDCKCDKNGHDKGDKDKDGYNKEGFDKDGFNKEGFDKDGYNKKGFDRNGKIKGDDGKIKDDDGKIKDDDGKIKGDDGKIKDDDGKIKGDKDGDDKVIEGKLVGLGHIDKEMCGANAEQYSTEKHVGKPAWFTRDLLKQFLPDLMENEKIMDRFKSTYSDQYHAENFGITFKCEEDEECGKNINFTLAAPSNMWCNKAGAKGTTGLQCREEIRSISKSSCCPSAMPYSSPINSENFFLNDKCPNLILDLPAAKLKECAGKIIVAKLEAPMVIVAKDNSVVDKNNHKIHDPKYLMLKDKLNYKGEIKDSAGKSPEKLEEVKESIERGLWTSDKEVKLKIPDMPSYSPGANYDEDETFLYFYNEGKYEEEVLQAKAEAEKLKIQVQKDGYDEDGFNKDGFNEKGYHRSDKEVLLKSAFSHSTQEANLNYYDNEDNSVSVDTNFI